MARMVLVTGASGQQGHAVAEALLARGHKVRTFTRHADNPAVRALVEKGAEVAVGNFEDAAHLTAAAKGTDTAFLMSTPFEAGVEAETRQGIAAADAITAGGVGHLIYASVANADKQTGIPHFESKYEVERHIAGLGVPFTISAPVAFMDNAIAGWSIDSLRSGTQMFSAPADRNMQLVAVADIGTFVASLVERREAVFGHRYDIASDELTGNRQAAILSKAAGRTINYFGIPPEIVRQQQGDDGAIMAEWFDAVGYSAEIAKLRETFPEVGWHTYADWATGVDWDGVLASGSKAA